MVSAAIIAFAIAFACSLFLVSRRARHLVLDRANERSLHKTPVPRSGGLAIALGAAAASGVAWSWGMADSDGAGGNSVQAALLISAALVAVSFADDALGVPLGIRLAAHLAAAGIYLALTLPNVDPVAFVALTLGMTWLTNLYNFMDGSDGMAVIGFGAFAIASHCEGVAWLAIASTAIASAAFAFLCFNFAPARLFMGDGGSIPLGFLSGALGLAGWQAGAWEWWFPLLVFSPFIMDATATLAKRAWRGQKVWIAHRDHYYQRLVRMGWGHRSTALSGYFLMATCAGVAIALRSVTAEIQGIVVALCALAYLLLAVWIDRLWSRFGAAGAA